MELRKCYVCGGKLRSEALGWICYDCQGFIDMQGVFHEHKEKPFMPPMTNADRIRAMSDEELAETLIQYDYFCDMFTADDGMKYYDFEAAKEAELEWLKQPAEGE